MEGLRSVVTGIMTFAATRGCLPMVTLKKRAVGELMYEVK